MLKGTCPKCGECYYGFALVNPQNQACGRCGSALEITNGYKTFTGFSPFAAKKVEEDSKEKKTKTDDPPKPLIVWVKYA